MRPVTNLENVIYRYILFGNKTTNAKGLCGFVAMALSYLALKGCQNDNVLNVLEHESPRSRLHGKDSSAVV